MKQAKNANMGLTNIKSLLLGSVLLTLFASGWWFYNSQRQENIGHNTANHKPPGPEHIDLAAKGQSKDKQSKALTPQVRDIRDSEEMKNFRLDVDYIYQLLSKVNLDSDGQLVLGAREKKLLEKAFRGVDYNLTDAELEQIASLIKIGLPGEPGEKTASLVINYYHFKSAEKTLIEQFDTTDMDALQSNYQQLIELRIAHLGYETNQQLFGSEQRKQQYMIESMLLQKDTHLSAEERQEKQAALAKKYQQTQEPHSETD